MKIIWREDFIKRVKLKTLLWISLKSYLPMTIIDKPQTSKLSLAHVEHWQAWLTNSALSLQVFLLKINLIFITCWIQWIINYSSANPHDGQVIYTQIKLNPHSTKTNSGNCLFHKEMKRYWRHVPVMKSMYVYRLYNPRNKNAYTQNGYSQI